MSSSRRIQKTFLLSLALHFALASIFLIFSRESRRIPETKDSHVLDIEMIGAAGNPGASSASARISRSLGRLVRLRDLAPDYDFSGKARNAGTAGGVGKGSAPAALRGVAVYQRIYQRIDGSLFYPSIFKQAGITGTVHARLRFSAEGKYLPAESVVEANSDYLRVLVRRILKSSLREPIPEYAKFFKGPLLIAAAFRFEFTEADTPELIASRKGFSGEGLQFYRNHHRSRLQWDLGPLSGAYGLPTVGLNVAWLLEKAGDALSGKRRIDPMAEYREDPDWARAN